MSRCVITGCDLVDGSAGRWVHGDLHEEGECWIFTACCADGAPAWRDTAYQNIKGKYIIIIGNDYYFESRGVIVLPKDRSVLSQAAHEYIAS